MDCKHLHSTIRKLSFSVFFAFAFISFAFGQNPIVTENALPGTPQAVWDAGDNSTIEGYAQEFSVNKGETVHFKITVESAATLSYTVKIYRIGWYQGNGARFIADLGPLSGNQQQSCNYETATGKVDCSNWTISAQWPVPATAVSGVYLARLDCPALGSNSKSVILFVVRDDAANSPVLFKTSDATWQAYNLYGGNNFYNATTPVPGYTHATKVSYQRIISLRTDKSNFFNSEYPMIRWLERNGYNLSYSTDLDMARDPSPITPAIHKTILSVGHDEYWSAEQRTKIETARNNGVNIAFFSGNNVYWKTRWEDNYQTLVCYKEGTMGESVCGTKCDPLPNVWTGLWRDGCPPVYAPNDACLPEGSLVGQMSWTQSTGSIKVPDTYKNLRFWKHTSIASLGSGQTATLPYGTLGNEWDPEQFVSTYPSHRVILSNTIQTSKVHKMALYRHSSGALVFSAGTMQWPWGLDDAHDLNTATPPVQPVSQDMQQATVNLLHDMGLTAGSLQGNLVAPTIAPDVSPPGSTITFPTHNSTVPGGLITITGTSADNGSGAVAGVEVSIDNGTTWQIATGLESWSYAFSPAHNGTITIKVRAWDDLGNVEVVGSPGSPNCITITPSGPFNQSVFNSTYPLTTPSFNFGDPVELGMRFRSTVAGSITGFRYYKGPGITGVHTGHLWTNTGTLLASQVFTNETPFGWQTATLSTPVPIAANTTYVVSYFSPSGEFSRQEFFFTQPIVNGVLRGLADGEDGGNGIYAYSANPVFPIAVYNSSNYFADVIFATNDITAPQVVSVTPVNNSTGVALNIHPTATFNEPIDPATVTTTTVFMTAPGNVNVPGTVALSNGNIITFTPNSNLSSSTLYTMTLKGGTIEPRVRDISGNGLATDYTWSFTTGTLAAPTITTHPVSQSACANTIVNFVSAASGIPTPTVQWQVSTNNGSSWSNIIGEISGTYSFTAVLADNNKQYRAVWTNSQGFANSNPAVLTVSPIITGTLAAVNANICVGSPMQLQLSSATGPSPYSLVINSNTYTGITVGQPFRTVLANETIWPGSSTPAQLTVSDNVPLEVGVQFKTNKNGVIKGIRFYKGGTANGGTHIGSLWTQSGTLLASATFTNESSSGWQEVLFATPVNVTANTIYVASYFLPLGHYSRTADHFLTDHFNGNSLTAPDWIETPNGVYAYSSQSTFPSNNIGAHNYWVDVVFAAYTTTTTTFDFTSITASNGCSLTGNPINSATITVSPIKSAGTVSGQSPLCVSATATYTTNGDPGGTWISSNTSVATVNPTTGFVTALSLGNANIQYEIASCNGTVSSFKVLTVAPNTTGNAGTVTGTSPLCAGATTTYSSNGDAGGVWSSSDVLVATVNSSTGLVTAVGAGTCNIIYSITGGCNGTPSAQQSITVIASSAVGSVTGGTSPLCVGATTTCIANGVVLGSGTGAWSSSDVLVATVNSSTGLVTAVGTGTCNIIYTITGGCNGTVSAQQSITVTTTNSAVTSVTGGASPICITTFTTNTGANETIWPTETPFELVNPEANPVELGIKFKANKEGVIKGIRFYKGSAANGGTHTGSLWSQTGTLLASATFTGESASGWQEVLFSSPVSVSANTIYVASYFAPLGHYSRTVDYFHDPHSNGISLTATEWTESEHNGVYRYSPTSTFPADNFLNPNYWVDVVYAPYITVPTTTTCTANGVVLGAGTGAWSSSNAAVATVNNAGVVTAQGAGTCNIIYTITGGCNGTVSAQQSITVTPNAAITSVTGGTGILTIGGTTTCTANGVVLGGGTGTWSSNNVAVATVDNTGLVTGVGNGACDIIYTITGGCNGTVSAKFQIKIGINEFPVITCPANLTIGTNTGCTYVGTIGTPIITDNKTHDHDMIITNDAPAAFPIGATTVTWTTEDEDGNTSSCSHVVTVIDDDAPVITICPPPVTVNCHDPQDPANTGGFASATDNCTASPVITYTDVTVLTACVSNYTINRTWKATDSYGNSSTCLQVITVQDITAPTASNPTTINVECYSSIPAANVSVVTTEADNCDPAPVVTLLTDIPGAPVCNGGPISVSRVYRITDCSGNSTTVTQTINVADITAPTASNPTTINVQCYSSIPAANVSVVTDETDNCDPAPVVTLLTDIPGAPVCNGGPISVSRVYRITDCSGNSTTVTQTINVSDITAPTASNPITINVECYGSIPVANISVVTDEADNCDATPVVTLLTDIPGAPVCNGGPISVSRVYRITDCSGNSTTVTQTINVADITAPTASNPTTINVECYSSIPAANVSVVTDEADNCDPAPVVTLLTDIPGAPVCNGGPISVSRVYRITDCSGNSTAVTQTINVSDITAPTASNPITINVECYGSIPVANISVVTDEADNCDATPVVTLLTDIPGAPVCNGGPISVSRVYRITDCSGNSTTVTQTINVADITAPTASNPTTINVECYSSIPAANVSVVTTEADNCDPAPVVTLLTDIPGAPVCNGGPISVSRVYRITDCSGNSTTVTQTINVADITAPTASNPTTINVECYGSIPAANVSVVTTEADNCDPAPVVTLLTDIPGAPVCNGGPISVSRVYRITDCSGNSTTVTQTINVADITAPTASNPTTINVQCYSSIPAANVSVVTDEADNCDPAPVVTLLTDIPGAPVCNGGPITVSRVYRITDCSGNSAAVTQTINVSDITAPTASNPITINVECYGSIPVANISVVTDEADNCDATPVVTLLTDIPGAPVCNGGPISVSRVYRITDCSGNSTTVTQTINVADITAPTASNPTTINVECYSSIPAANVSVVTTEADNCDPAPVVTLLTDIPGAPVCNGGPISVSRVYRITDCSGNSTTVTQTINVADITAPTASNPTTINVECYSSIPAANVSVVTDEADNCDPAPVVTLLTDIPAAPVCNGGPISVSRVYRITDCSGNSTTVTQTINVADITAPTASNPTTINVECYGSIPAANVSVVTDEADNCDPAPVVTLLTDIPAAPVCNGGPISVSRVYRITDCSGNSTTVTQTINVADITAPTASNPTTINVECYGSIPAANISVVTDEADNCDAAPVVTLLTDIPSAPVCNGGPISVSRVYRITDCSGNSTAVTQTINVSDITAPTASNPITINVECYGSIPAANISVVTDEADNCDATPVVTLLTDIPSAPVCNGGPISVSRVYRITDCSGNSTTVTQTINVADITAPTASNPTTINVECYSSIPAANVSVVTTEADNCDPAPVVTLLTDIPGAPVCNGGPISVSRVYRITDCSGNSTTVTQTINVADITAPTASNPTTINVQCYGSIPAANVSVVTDEADNCDPAPVVTLLTDIPGAPVCNGGPITVSRVYRITDCSGNSTAVTQTINVSDITAPTASNPITINVECYGSIPVANISVVTDEADNCDAAPVVTLLTDIPSAPVCNGGPISVLRVYRITDCSGNSTTVTQTINVADITAPIISNIPANVSVSCASEIPAPNTGAVIASDNCSGILTVTSSDVIIPGSCANRLTLNRTYTVSDCSGNSSSAVQVITVNDQTGPVLTPPATQILDVGAGAGCSVLMPDYRSLITATDACGGTVTLEQLAPNAPGSTVTGYGSTRTISFIGTDVCGNTSTTEFTLNLVDATAPNAICQNITVDLDAAGNASITAAMVNNGSNDNCSAVILVSALPNTFNCSNVGANTVTLTVIDNAGNTSTCQSIVTVRDLIAPTISCWGDTTIAKGVNCTNILGDLTFRVNTTDNCAIASVTQNIPAGTVIGSSVQFVDLTIKVTDANGNSSTCTFRVNFTDQTTPVISGCPSNITISTGTGNILCSQTTTWTAPTADDNCGIATFTSTHNPGDAFPVGTTTVIYTATDVNGNTATCSFTVTVIDNTKPVITGCPANISLTSNAGNPATCSQIVTWIAPTAADNCGIASFTSTHNPGTVFLLGTTIVTYTATDIHGNTQTCSFTVTVVDDTKPDFTFCPSPVINAPTNGAGCIATIVTSNPIVSDNCTTIISLTWTLTGATTGASAGTGINYLGTYNFNVGTTTVTYAATDASGNTRNCIFTVSVVNTTSGTIGGTTTVVQNGSTTSNITFIGTGGIKPYTFTYNISVNGGAPGSNQTVTTTGSNNVVAVSQSNAVIGTYKYTLVSVTDANGCSGTLPVPPANEATITVIAQVSNLSPAAFMDNINFTAGSVGVNRDFIVEIDEVAGAASSGTITVRISKPSAFNISFNPVSGNSNVFGGTPNTNSDFTFADLGGFYQLTTTVPIGAFGFKIAGLMINRKPGIPSNTTQNISIQIVPGSGGDNTNGNNLVSLRVTAN